MSRAGKARPCARCRRPRHPPRSLHFAVETAATPARCDPDRWHRSVGCLRLLFARSLCPALACWFARPPCAAARCSSHAGACSAHPYHPCSCSFLDPTLTPHTLTCRCFACRLILAFALLRMRPCRYARSGVLHLLSWATVSAWEVVCLRSDAHPIQPPIVSSQRRWDQHAPSKYYVPMIQYIFDMPVRRSAGHMHTC